MQTVVSWRRRCCSRKWQTGSFESGIGGYTWYYKKKDGVVIEAVKVGGNEVLNAITKLFNQCLTSATKPTIRNNAVINIIHKKGNIPKIFQKLLTKIIAKHLNAKMEFYQPQEQAGFRQWYGTNDQLTSHKVSYWKMCWIQ